MQYGSWPGSSLDESDFGEPLAVGRVAAFDDIEESLLQLFRDGAHDAITNRSVVDFANRGNFGGRSREEAFVREPQLVSRDATFANLDAQLARECHDRVARDSLKNRGREVGCVKNALLDDENVLARSLGHKSIGIEKNGLVVPTKLRLALREYAVGVLAHDLSLRQADVDVVPSERANFATNSASEGLVTKVRAPLPRNHRASHRVVRRVDSHVAFAEEHHRAEVTLRHTVHAQGFEASGHHLFARDARHKKRELARVEQPVDVLAQLEHRGLAVRALVGSDALEGPETVVERVREDVNLSVFPGDHLAVEPDLLNLVNHWAATIVGELRSG